MTKCTLLRIVATQKGHHLFERQIWFVLFELRVKSFDKGSFWHCSRVIHTLKTQNILNFWDSKLFRECCKKVRQAQGPWDWMMFEWPKWKNKYLLLRSLFRTRQEFWTNTPTNLSMSPFFCLKKSSNWHVAKQITNRCFQSMFYKLNIACSEYTM